MGSCWVDRFSNLFADFLDSNLFSHALSALLPSSFCCSFVIFASLLIICLVLAPLEFPHNSCFMCTCSRSSHIFNDRGDVFNFLLDSKHVLNDLFLKLWDVLGLNAVVAPASKLSNINEHLQLFYFEVCEELLGEVS